MDLKTPNSQLFSLILLIKLTKIKKKLNIIDIIATIIENKSIKNNELSADFNNSGTSKIVVKSVVKYGLNPFLI